MTGLNSRYKILLLGLFRESYIAGFHVPTQPTVGFCIAWAEVGPIAGQDAARLSQTLFCASLNAKP